MAGGSFKPEPPQRYELRLRQIISAELKVPIELVKWNGTYSDNFSMSFRVCPDTNFETLENHDNSVHVYYKPLSGTLTFPDHVVEMEPPTRVE